jgi:hypothetical protein
VLRARAVERVEDENRVSDATPALLERQLGEFESLDEVPPERHLVVETDQELPKTVAAVRIALKVLGLD